MENKKVTRGPEVEVSGHEQPISDRCRPRFERSSEKTPRGALCLSTLLSMLVLFGALSPSSVEASETNSLSNLIAAIDVYLGVSDHYEGCKARINREYYNCIDSYGCRERPLADVASCIQNNCGYYIGHDGILDYMFLCGMSFGYY